MQAHRVADLAQELLVQAGVAEGLAPAGHHLQGGAACVAGRRWWCEDCAATISQVRHSLGASRSNVHLGLLLAALHAYRARRRHCRPSCRWRRVRAAAAATAAAAPIAALLLPTASRRLDRLLEACGRAVALLSCTARLHVCGDERVWPFG